MFVLYGCAFLSFILSFILFKLNKKDLGNTLITIALFLNPFGYDLVVFWINSITKDYWMTMSIMYTLAGLFFALFMYLYNINPVYAFRYHSIKTRNHIKRKLKQKNGKL
jgi:multisubunit Na+/H+ antiporter MnhB subunit